MIYAATGHRLERFNYTNTNLLYKKLIVVAQNYLQTLKIEYLISGGAQGWDTAIAIAAIELEIPYMLALPFAKMGSGWIDEHKNNLVYIKKHAFEVKNIRMLYAKDCFYIRDKWMVDNSNKIIAMYDGNPFGGTYKTIEFATQQNKEVINLYNNLVV